MTIANFSNSPLSEVVCGVEFNAPGFSSVHFGLYWQTIREHFPQYFDMPPIGEISLFSPIPILRRVWLESVEKKQLIQLQADRFLYNWRRLPDDTEEYPHFETVYLNFIEEWKHFQKWWLGVTISPAPIFPVRYQLTYLNQIDNILGWETPADHYNIFTFMGRKWDSFLDNPTVHVSNLQFSIPQNRGILSVNINQGLLAPENKPVMTFELTAQSSDATIDIDEWFNTVHEYVVRSFLDLTKDSIQKEWGLE